MPDNDVSHERSPVGWDRRLCPHCGHDVDLDTSGIYRASFNFNGQSNVTTIDSMERCLDWLTRWTRLLTPRMNRASVFRVNELVYVGHHFKSEIDHAG